MFNYTLLHRNGVQISLVNTFGVLLIDNTFKDPFHHPSLAFNFSLLFVTFPRNTFSPLYATLLFSRTYTFTPYLRSGNSEQFWQSYANFIALLPDVCLVYIFIFLVFFIVYIINGSALITNTVAIHRIFSDIYQRMIYFLK